MRIVGVLFEVVQSGLHAAADVNFSVNRGYVGPNCVLGYREHSGNLFVAITSGQEGERFLFASTEFRPPIAV